MNADEYGNILRLNVSEDISNRTNTLFLTSPAPVYKMLIITAANGLSVGTQDIQTPEGDFFANQYVEYTIKEGDIFISGVWEARLRSQSSDQSECKITDVINTFTVDP